MRIINKVILKVYMYVEDSNTLKLKMLFHYNHSKIDDKQIKGSPSLQKI